MTCILTLTLTPQHKPQPHGVNIMHPTLTPPSPHPHTLTVTPRSWPTPGTTTASQARTASTLTRMVTATPASMGAMQMGKTRNRSRLCRRHRSSRCPVFCSKMIIRRKWRKKVLHGGCRLHVHTKMHPTLIHNYRSFVTNMHTLYKVCS